MSVNTFLRKVQFEFGLHNSATFDYRTFIRTIPRGGSQNHSCSNPYFDDHFMFVRTERTQGFKKESNLR